MVGAAHLNKALALYFMSRACSLITKDDADHIAALQSGNAILFRLTMEVETSLMECAPKKARGSLLLTDKPGR